MPTSITVDDVDISSAVIAYTVIHDANKGAPVVMIELSPAAVELAYLNAETYRMGDATQAVLKALGYVRKDLAVEAIYRAVNAHADAGHSIAIGTTQAILDEVEAL